MKFNNSHKALAITFFIAASLVLSVASFNIVKYQKIVTETLVDISLVEPIEAPISNIKTQKKGTNKSFNETEKPKHFSQAYQPIAPPKDYERQAVEKEDNAPKKPQTETEQKGIANIQHDELTAFESVNAVLKKQTTKSSSENGKKTTNTNSTVRYSLVNRTDEYLPIPIYLCEEHGTIIVNITVTRNGRVKETSINSTSNSNNKCLQNSALDYAKKARFNKSDTPEQIGTITFTFEGK